MVDNKSSHFRTKNGLDYYDGSADTAIGRLVQKIKQKRPYEPDKWADGLVGTAVKAYLKRSKRGDGSPPSINTITIDESVARKWYDSQPNKRFIYLSKGENLKYDRLTQKIEPSAGDFALMCEQGMLAEFYEIYDEVTGIASKFIGKTKE